jgi:hypothetical protein
LTTEVVCLPGIRNISYDVGLNAWQCVNVVMKMHLLN